MAGRRRRDRGPAGHNFWRSLPRRSYLLFLAAVFFNFASVGFITDVLDRGRYTGAGLVLATGLVAVGYAYAMTRKLWAMAILMPAQAIVSIALPKIARVVPPTGELAEKVLRARLLVDGFGMIAAIAVGYTFFVIFITVEGTRHHRVQAEIDLARELHESLVPPLSVRCGRYEVHGRSLPTAEMGGDLLDLVTRDGGESGEAGLVTAYVADVSGHGVRAGAVMGMVKAAARTQLAGAGSPGPLAPIGSPESLERLFTELNRMLLDLTRPGTFVTFAALQLAADGTARWALAGHLPILHHRRASGEVRRLTQASMALGLSRERTFPSLTEKLEAGDLLAILTDGMTEVFDRQRVELGLAPFEEVLRAHAGEPLPAIADALIERAERHGQAHDDRTVLLVRVI